MDHNCKSCGADEFSEENCEKICTNCGQVQDDLSGDGNLCMVPDGDAMLDTYRNKNFEAKERLTNRIRGETNNAAARREITREKMIGDMRNVVRQIIKHASAVDETMDLIEATFKAYKGRLMSSKKLGFVGACIYYLSAKNQLGISLSDICKCLGIKMKIISVCLKQVKELTPEFEYERPNIKDLVKKYVDEVASKYYDPTTLEVSSPNKVQYNNQAPKTKDLIPLINNNDRTVLQNRVMLLLDLFEAMHPYNQPSPQSMITPVIYHAWRSLDTFKLIAMNLKSGIQTISSPENSVKQISDPEENQIDRKVMIAKHSISFEKFCQICDMKCSSNGYKIVSKLQSSLLTLGRHLGDVNKINLPWFLKDIIENSPDLLQEHMRAEPKISTSSKESH